MDHVCFVCNKKFNNEQYLKQHFSWCHKDYIDKGFLWSGERANKNSENSDTSMINEAVNSVINTPLLVNSPILNFSRLAAFTPNVFPGQNVFPNMLSIPTNDVKKEIDEDDDTNEEESLTKKQKTS